MKLIIQIPCLNEADTLPAVLADLPTTLPGLDVIETLVIDDGSQDETVAVARRCGVTHVVRHGRNRGLAQAFQTGLETCLRLGADVIVHTDADHQYPGRYIADLVGPVLAGSAEIVIGDRQVQHTPYFSPFKKRMQRLGSGLVRNLSGLNVPDTVSGFRAYSREAALRFTILTRYSYTLETLIQAGKQGLSVTSIPIETNPPTRPSRLQRNMWHFIKQQTATLLRVYAFYEPLRTFSYLALPFLLAGFSLLARFFYFYLSAGGAGKIQSVSIGVGLFLVGVITALFGLQADIAGKHRQLTQETLYRLKKMELQPPPSPNEREPNNQA